MRTERLMPNGVPKNIRCYDNQGESFDRYTCVFTKTEGYYYLGMSENPFHPQGFGQHGQGKDGPIDRPSYSHLGKKVDFSLLPEDVQKCIIETYKELWNLPRVMR